MKNNKFIFANGKYHLASNRVALTAGLDFLNTQYQALGGLTNWNRACYHECLYQLLRLSHPNSPEYDAQINPLSIVADFHNTRVSHDVLGMHFSIATKDFIKIIEESFLFRHYVREAESSKELIRLAIHKLINEKPKYSLDFNKAHTVTISHESHEVNVHIVLTEQDYDKGINHFINRIDFESDMK